MKRYRIVLADDHRLFRLGLKKILAENNDLEVVGEVGDALELLKLLPKLDPQMIMLDISMSKLRGIEAIPEIKRTCPGVKVIILTMHNDSEYLFEAISAGADGYLLKDDAEKDLFFAIDMVSQGQIYISRFLAEESRKDWAQIRRGARRPESSEPLTTRERQILKLIAEGKSSREIGGVLFISHRTVERHRANIMSKLNLSKSMDLLRYAIQKGYI
jgi:DNA-binding NarL/FixJ family response regulator